MLSVILPHNRGTGAQGFGNFPSKAPQVCGKDREVKFLPILTGEKFNLRKCYQV